MKNTLFDINLSEMENLVLWKNYLIDCKHSSTDLSSFIYAIGMWFDAFDEGVFSLNTLEEFAQQRFKFNIHHTFNVEILDLFIERMLLDRGSKNAFTNLTEYMLGAVNKNEIMVEDGIVVMDEVFLHVLGIWFPNGFGKISDIVKFYQRTPFKQTNTEFLTKINFIPMEGLSFKFIDSWKIYNGQPAMTEYLNSCACMAYKLYVDSKDIGLINNNFYNWSDIKSNILSITTKEDLISILYKWELHIEGNGFKHIKDQLKLESVADIFDDNESGLCDSLDSFGPLHAKYCGLSLMSEEQLPFF